MFIKKPAFFLVVFISISLFGRAQTQELKDGVPIDHNGLEVTLRVVNKEAITISGTNYDRYKVVAAIKNNSEKSFNVRLNKYPDAGSITGGKLVELNCINATGARLTSKRLAVSMLPHQVNVTYLSRDKDGKLINSVMTIIVGYYLDPGQGSQNDAIFIIPAGEELKVTANFF
ncbi:hypothetical protein ACI6Q2_15440 [Chitinophagaceae bacterium LWZ2-11]